MQNIFTFIIIVLVGVVLYSAFTTGGGIHWKNFFVVPGISSSPRQAPPPSTVTSQPVQISTPTAPTPPSGFTAKQLSPLYGNVRIISFMRQWYGGVSELDLQSDGSLSQKVDVTGWRIAGNNGNFIIPQAIAIYTSYGISEVRDVVVGAGEYVRIMSGLSPIGQNLRLNECTGYLNNVYSFTPALPNDCPGFDRSESAMFSGRCQSFVQSLYGCRQPTASELNTFTNYGDELCHAYLEKINYSGCYAKHSGDSNFFSRDWRIWVGGIASFPFTASEHDRFLLFDRGGLLVDEYTY